MSQPIRPLEAELVLGFCVQVDRALALIGEQCANDPALLRHVTNLSGELAELIAAADRRTLPGYPTSIDVRAGERPPCVREPREPGAGRPPCIKDKIGRAHV